MRTKAPFIIMLMVTLLFAGCSPPSPDAAPTGEPPLEVPAEEAPMEEPVEEVAVNAETTEEPVPNPQTPEGKPIDYSAAAPPQRPRIIIKNAELQLLVSDSDIAVDRTTQIAANYGGYIISSRIWYKDWQDDQYKYASLTLGVPVEQFEPALNRLRGLAIRVKDETASGQDVTDEYVDLQSRVRNLEATRDRIRDFLDQAETVEESLRVNEQLAAIEAQIEEARGRMNYLSNRGAYSTIAVQIDPELPKPTPTPTPTPPAQWSVTRSVREATETLGGILRVFVEIFVWFSIVGVPLLAPLVLSYLIIRRRTR